MARGNWLKKNKAAEAVIKAETAECRIKHDEDEAAIKAETAEYRAEHDADRKAEKQWTAAFREKNVAPKMERAKDRARVYFGLGKRAPLPTEAEGHAEVQGESDPTMPEKSFLE